MEIELDLQGEKARVWQAIVGVMIILSLIGLGALGSRVTASTADGSPKLLTWQDWRLMQAEQKYYAELSILRSDVDQLAVMLESHPSPVAAQILTERIAKHTKSGDDSLSAARESVMVAARDVRDWAAGVLDRDTAIQTVQVAFEMVNQ